jgi:lysophospholipase L1-like esterase
LVTACLLALASSARADPPLAIVIGDSLAREYDNPPVNIQGWGYELPKYFGPGLQWRNDAWGGESTASFIAEGRLNKALVANPRFLLIMFGTNDCCEGGQQTDQGTYRANLHRMISDARNIGAEPILVTSPPLRTPDYDGIGVLSPGFVASYADAAAAQAEQDGAPVVMIYWELLSIYEGLGQAGAQALYGLDNPPGSPDLIHFSPYGADWVAQQIAKQLPSVAPDLAAYLATPPATPPPLPIPALPGAWPAALAFAIGSVLARETRLTGDPSGIRT